MPDHVFHVSDHILRRKCRVETDQGIDFNQNTSIPVGNVIICHHLSASVIITVVPSVAGQARKRLCLCSLKRRARLCRLATRHSARRAVALAARSRGEPSDWDTPGNITGIGWVRIRCALQRNGERNARPGREVRKPSGE